MVLDELARAIDKLVATDPHTRADGETIIEMHRQLARFEGVLAQSTAAFDASGLWRADGARTAAAWIAARCHIPQAKAKRRVALGRALRHMPHAEMAWLAGDIGESHIATFCRVHNPRTAGAFAESEADLVHEAKRLRFGAFVNLVTYWSYRADPDDAEGAAEKRHAERDVYLVKSGWDMWLGGITLDPIGGTIVANELKRIEAEFFEADWAEAKARVGEAVCVADLRRTPAQRRADALIEMATRSAAMPADARRPEPLFSVLVNYETFAGTICELANGQVVTPGQLVRWLDRAWIERVVFDGPSRVIDLGEARRLFRGATRRAVQLRDQECFHDLCDERAEDCQIDHVLPWAAGGETTQANGRVACGFHNRARSRGP